MYHFKYLTIWNWKKDFAKLQFVFYHSWMLRVGVGFWVFLEKLTNGHNSCKICLDTFSKWDTLMLRKLHLDICTCLQVWGAKFFWIFHVLRASQVFKKLLASFVSFASFSNKYKLMLKTYFVCTKQSKLFSPKLQDSHRFSKTQPNLKKLAKMALVRIPILSLYLPNSICTSVIMKANKLILQIRLPHKLWNNLWNS
jgi:hypothetical protein